MKAIVEQWALSLSPAMAVSVTWCLLAVCAFGMVAVSLNFIGGFLDALRRWREYRECKRAERASEGAKP